MAPDTAGFLQSSAPAREQPENRGGVTRCNSHEGLVREVTLLGAAVLHSSEKSEASFKAIHDTLQQLTSETAKQSQSLDNLDPAATKARLTYHGLIVSGIVSLGVACIANTDKLLTLWRYLFGTV